MDKKPTDNMLKTYLAALFCVVRCILYPGTKIVVCAGTRMQANETLSKITDEFMKLHEWGSDILNAEVDDYAVTANKAFINFKNGSWIQVKTSSDTARGARANVLLKQLTSYMETYSCNRAKSVKAKWCLV